MDSKKVINEIKKGIPRLKQHGKYQMSLSGLIKALQKERAGLLVKITDKHYPGRSHSYYGYHTDLAFEPVEEPITVAEFLKECQDAVGKSFITADNPDAPDKYFKDYTMKINAPLWISTLGQASKQGIVDLVPTDDYIKIVTKTIEDEEEDDGSE